MRQILAGLHAMTTARVASMICMPAPEPNWTDILQTAFLGGQLVLLVLAAIFGWRQLIHARELREDQTRPFVVIDLASTRKPFFDLVITNIGTTMARDVTFEFTPAPVTTMKEASLDKLKVFREGISTLPPGKEIRALFDSGPARHSAGLPDLYEVTVGYRGHDGSRRYSETMNLDFGLYWNRMSVTLHTVHDLHKEVKRIREEIRKWTAANGGGLLHVTSTDMELRVQELERQIRQRRDLEGA